MPASAGMTIENSGQQWIFIGMTVRGLFSQFGLSPIVLYGAAERYRSIMDSPA
jgi:hypothetical protein